MSDSYCGMQISTRSYFPCPESGQGLHFCVDSPGHIGWHHCTCGTLWAPPDAEEAR